MLKVTLNSELILSQNALGFGMLSENVKSQLEKLMLLKKDKFTNYGFMKSLDDDCYYGAVSGIIVLKGEIEVLNIEFNGLSHEDFQIILNNLK